MLECEGEIGLALQPLQFIVEGKLHVKMYPTLGIQINYSLKEVC
jgi:hypothetical protein